MIRIQNLTRRYGSVVAVHDVSLEIERGEVVGLLGHNGAGKTTVMKILTGFLEPSEGSVSVGGIDVVRDRRGAQRQIGYLPENAPLYPEMVVQDYLRMLAGLRGVAPHEIDAAVIEAAVATGLHDHMVSPISTLSKGYRQRVGLAQAIVHRPEVLVLDEPTNGLDPVQIQSIRELILRLAEKTTIILSTHILQEIEAVCDRVLVLIDGCLAADGSLASLLASEAIALSLARDAADPVRVRERLCALPGVVAAECRGEEPGQPGFDSWRITCPPGPTSVQAILDAGREAGWRIGAVAPERRTLESVFQSLQHEHVATRLERIRA
jgi:ABC-2 type transport system ATP-binding protein